MKHSLRFAIILLLLGLASGAWAEFQSVRLLMGKREILTTPAAVTDGTRVLAPLAVLTRLGVNNVVASDGKTVSIVGQGGTLADIAVVDVSGTPMVQMEEVLKVVGGELTVDVENRSASIRAHLTSVEFVDGALHVNCTLPVVCSASLWNGKILVDVPGAKLVSEAKEIYVGGDVVTKARLGQYDDDTARVVLDLAKPAGFKIESSLPALQLILRVAQDIPLALPQPKDPPAGVQPFDITAVRIEPVDDTRFDLIIETSTKGSVSVSKSKSPPEITLILKGGRLSQAVKQVDGIHAILKDARFAQASISPPMARVHMNLKRVVLTDVRVEDRQIRVGVRLPDKAGGTLAGKLVVIDPGHGGKQPGACAGGIKEKDLNTKLAAALAAALESAGARVALTRSTDATMELASRPAVAVQASADFFVSLHCNSTVRPNSTSGIETYHYPGAESAPLLADAVQKSVCAATGMCDRKSGGLGLMVLRLLQDTGIPGVLVECGYLNHSRDRAKLLDDDYRKKVADGIVSGLKAYIEGTP